MTRPQPLDRPNRPDPAPEAAVSCHCDGAPRGAQPPTLRRRAEFLRAASARRQAMPGFLLQARPRGDEDGFRVGYTCSKKLGNAVTRNRAKRRLRALARAVMPDHARAGWDYVLVGRPGATVSRDFALLCADLRTALARVHAPARTSSRATPRASGPAAGRRPA